MKKIYLIIIIIMCSGKILCQPVLTAVNTNPVVGDSYHGHTSGYQTSPGSAGANQTWDFSFLTPQSNILDSLVQPSLTMYYSDFPTANISHFNNGWNEYYKTYTDSLVLLGAEGLSWYAINTNPQKTLNYPFTFNSTINDYYFSNNSSAGTLETVEGTETITGDGYGTLILPYGTLSNVLRVKTQGTETYTVNGNPTTGTFLNYKWYLPGIHDAVLTYYYLGSGSYNTQYLTVSANSINENHDYLNDISIYPNPVTDNIIININSLNKEDVIFIYDSEGKLLMNQLLKQAKSEIDISMFAKGMYLLKINTEHGVITKKIIKE